MTRVRFTVAQLMAIVLYFAFGLAALRYANVFWASATFTIAVTTVLVALVGAISRKGEARMAWAGFAVFGSACLIIEYSPSGWMSPGERPLMLVAWGFRGLQPYLQQPMFLGEFDMTSCEQVSCSLEIILSGLVGAVLSRFVAAREGQFNPKTNNLNI